MTKLNLNLLERKERDRERERDWKGITDLPVTLLGDVNIGVLAGEVIRINSTKHKLSTIHIFFIAVQPE